MKQFFTRMLYLTAAIISASMFVSCGGDDEEEMENPENEKYFACQYWLSDDILEISDITVTGLSDIAFTQSMQTEYLGETLNGKACKIIELNGDQVDETSFSIDIKLKENWREILGERESIKSFRASCTIDRKGATLKWGMPVGGTLNINNINDSQIQKLVSNLSFHHTAE